MTFLSTRLFDLLVNEKITPLDVEFDLDKVKSAIADASPDELLFFRVLETFNNFYYEAIKLVFDTLEEYQFTRDELINGFFAKANMHCISVLESSFQSAMYREVSPDMERMRFSKTVDHDGNEVISKDSIEIVADVLNVILEHQIKYGIFNKYKDDEAKHEKDDIYKCLQSIHYYFNLIFNLKSAYDDLIYLEAEFTLDTEGLKIIHARPSIEFVGLANDTRKTSHFNEILMPLMMAFQGKTIKGKSIGTIKIADSDMAIKVVTGDIKADATLFLDMRLDQTHEYLRGLELAAFENFKLSDLLILLNKLTDIVSYYQTGNQIKSGLIENAPAKLKEETLIEYLVQATDYPRSLIGKFIQSLLFDGSVSLWRAPIYQQGEFIYLVFSVLFAPNHDLYIDRWLRVSGIENSKRQAMWSDHVGSHLLWTSEQKEQKIKFDVLKKEAIGSVPENLVFIETGSQVLALLCITYDFPLEDENRRKTLMDISQIFETLNLDTVSNYAQEQNKKLLLIGLSNYLDLSGLVLNGIPILDLTLLLNYISVGKSQKVKAIGDGSNFQVRQFYEFKYYDNQAEFEENLEKFLLFPYPVHSILSKLRMKMIEVLPAEATPRIFNQAVEMVSEEEETALEIEDLDYVLKREYLVDERNKNNDQVIFQLLSRLFTKIDSIKVYNPELIIQTVRAIKTSQRISSVHLAFYMVKMLDRFQKQKFQKHNKFTHQSYDENDLDFISDKINTGVKGNTLQLSTYSDKFAFEELIRAKFISFLIDSIGNMPLKKMSMSELKFIYTQVVFLKGFYEDELVVEYIYKAIGNFIELLNFNHEYQMARDIAEETLIFSISINQKTHAWYILFNTYTKQKNIMYAGVYGNLLFTSLHNQVTIDKELLIDSLHAAIKYFREFRYLDLIKSIIKFAKSLGLSDYDNQKFTLIYFNSRLVVGLNRDKGLPEEIGKYLAKQKNNIIKFGDIGCFPWIGLLINFKHAAEHYGQKVPQQLLDDLAFFEAALHDKEVYQSIESITMGEEVNTAQNLVGALTKTFQTRSFEDYRYEIQNLSKLAQTSFILGLANKDFNILLLNSLILNDQRLSFDNIYVKDGTVKEFGAQVNKEFLNYLPDYIDYIKGKLNLKQGQALLWLFEIVDQTYSIKIDADFNLSIAEHANWDLQKMRYWLKNSLPKFYFNSQKNKYYDYQAQDLIYKELLNNLSDFDLGLHLDCQELLVLKSVDMSAYPDNMLVNKGDLLIRNMPICNILNLEHYLRNNNDYIIEELSITAWIPRKGLDITISYGYESLNETLVSHNAIIYEDITIKPPQETSLNIFLAHGNIGRDGFKYVEAGEDAMIINFEMFGKGDIAVLFICSSGSQKEDFFSQDVISLAQELIAQGYKSVIAPFWKYDVTMAQIWLKEFLLNLKNGYSVSEAVHLSNRKVGEYDNESGKLFHDPAGWAAMHLYGSPNVFIKNDIKNHEVK
ncbi:CHAT domain-containing protein [Mucilaginibacter sp. X5P1]|uniref:CHAT domain-containing protein n=1 Tax=Mucilaginibacter sp. X5P1 TaxID=2723088 RepID=UPI00161DB75B|nr:CHAT domain-containing protein [Mucilaginibacter sp. X5P1]MBB6141723.1 hypothetical protein [Mucilaginibacter sp. X5P1]